MISTTVTSLNYKPHQKMHIIVFLLFGMCCALDSKFVSANSNMKAFSLPSFTTTLSHLYNL
jgi:hypothetical protein